MSSTPRYQAKHGASEGSAGNPKPSPQWGRWRQSTVTMAGRKVIPANVNETDRQVIRSRMDSRSTNGRPTDDNGNEQ
jgi:hypothetical protein